MSLSSLTLACLLVAQAPPSDVVPINSRSFGIPISVDPAQRAQIKTLQLFSSPDQGKSWNQDASATPEQQQFRFNAPADGLYWFTVIVIDTKGVKTPDDPYHSQPAQKILVDTVPPLVKMLNAERPGEEAVVSWDIQEDHPDLASLRVEYRPQDAAPGAAWYTISLPNPQLKGDVHFKPTSPGAVAVRLEIKDTAGNAGGKEALVPPVPPPAAVPVASVPVTSPGTTAAATTPGTTAAATPPATLPVGREPVPAASPFSATPIPPPSTKVVIAESGGPTEEVIERTSLSPREPSAMPLPRAQLVNSRDLSLEYEVRSGPSGVNKVQLWMTKDDGRNWEFLTDDPDLKSPINATLPGEGIFGLRLVVESGAGLSKGQPQPGDVPEMRIEVDLQPPHVQLHKPEPDRYLRDALVVSWNAADRNLAPRPVRIEYAERPEGPWLPVAADLPGVGTYTWPLPRNVPYRVFLRVIAVDLAGNRTVAETRDPQLIDLTKPDCRLIGTVSGVKKPGDAAVPEGMLRPAPGSSGVVPASAESVPHVVPTPAPTVAPAASMPAPAAPMTHSASPTPSEMSVPTAGTMPPPPAPATHTPVTTPSDSGNVTGDRPMSIPPTSESRGSEVGMPAMTPPTAPQ